MDSFNFRCIRTVSTGLTWPDLFRDDFKTSVWDTGKNDTIMLPTTRKWSTAIPVHIKAKQGVSVKDCVKAINLPKVFTLSVDVKVLSGPPDATYGLMFRCQDFNNLYYYNVSESGPWGL